MDDLISDLAANLQQREKADLRLVVVDWVSHVCAAAPRILRDPHASRTTLRGCYSETGFYIGMDVNFVCFWRRHNCN
jgi:hypothetical protein